MKTFSNKKELQEYIERKIKFFNHKYFRINEYPEKKLIDCII